MSRNVTPHELMKLLSENKMKIIHDQSITKHESIPNQDDHNRYYQKYYHGQVKKFVSGKIDWPMKEIAKEYKEVKKLMEHQGLRFYKEMYKKAREETSLLLQKIADSKTKRTFQAKDDLLAHYKQHKKFSHLFKSK